MKRSGCNLFIILCIMGVVLCFSNCRGVELKCGKGTHEENGVCLPDKIDKKVAALEKVPEDLGLFYLKDDGFTALRRIVAVGSWVKGSRLLLDDIEDSSRLVVGERPTFILHMPDKPASELFFMSNIHRPPRKISAFTTVAAIVKPIKGRNGYYKFKPSDKLKGHCGVGFNSDCSCFDEGYVNNGEKIYYFMAR